MKLTHSEIISLAHKVLPQKVDMIYLPKENDKAKHIMHEAVTHFEYDEDSFIVMPDLTCYIINESSFCQNITTHLINDLLKTEYNK